LTDSQLLSPKHPVLLVLSTGYQSSRQNIQAHILD
jgi:hypothetical protein